MYLINPYKMTGPQEKPECLFWLFETNQMFRLSETIELGMEDPSSRPSIRLWHEKFLERGQCWIQGEVGDQAHLRKTSIVQDKPLTVLL